MSCSMYFYIYLCNNINAAYKQKIYLCIMYLCIYMYIPPKELKFLKTKWPIWSRLTFMLLPVYSLIYHLSYKANNLKRSHKSGFLNIFFNLLSWFLILLFMLIIEHFRILLLLFLIILKGLKCEIFIVWLPVWREDQFIIFLIK